MTTTVKEARTSSIPVGPREGKHEVAPPNKRVLRVKRSTVKKQRQARAAYLEARTALHAQLSTVYNQYPMGDVPFSTDPEYAHIDWIEGPILLMEQRWWEFGEKAEADTFWSVWAKHPNKIILHQQTTNKKAASVERVIDETFQAWKAWFEVEPYPALRSGTMIRYDFKASPSAQVWLEARMRDRRRKQGRVWLTLAFAALLTVFYHSVYGVLSITVQDLFHTLHPVFQILYPVTHAATRALHPVVVVLKALVGR
ncbi:MAG: hypothetical protein ACYCYO_03830 [Bacilli bacterium]